MSKGKLVEVGDVDTIFSAPREPYTQRLLAAIPGMGPVGDGVDPGEPDHRDDHDDKEDGA